MILFHKFRQQDAISPSKDDVMMIRKKGFAQFTFPSFLKRIKLFCLPPCKIQDTRLKPEIKQRKFYPVISFLD